MSVVGGPLPSGGGDVLLRGLTDDKLASGRLALGPLRGVDDDGLLALAKGGELAAFEALSARYSYRLFVFCRALVSDRELARDLLQDTMLCAWQRLETCKSWRGWVFTIARHTCASWLRAEATRSRRAQIVDVEQLQLEPGCRSEVSAAERAEQHEAVMELLAATSRLPSSQRRIIEGRLQGAAYRELAERFGISEKAARQAGYEARRRMSSSQATA
jgi:RNA polymerase sigma-70 factor (ECF subfamily)